MIPWRNMNIADILAVILLPIFSIIGVYYLGQKVKLSWQKVFIWILGYGIITLTIITIFFDIDLLSKTIFHIGYYPFSIGFICNWITYNLLPFLSIFYFWSKIVLKNRLLITMVILIILLSFLGALHNWMNQPIR